MYASNVALQSKRDFKARLTRHAQKRSQQRGLPADAIPMVLAYGERTYDGKGGIRCLMTDRSIAQLVRALGHTQRIDALAGTYVVVNAENPSQVITVAHRYS